LASVPLLKSVPAIYLTPSPVYLILFLFCNSWVVTRGVPERGCGRGPFPRRPTGTEEFRKNHKKKPVFVSEKAG